MINNCYVIANGECISPLECDHGPPLPVKEFVSIVKDIDNMQDALEWISNKALEFQNTIELTSAKNE